MSEIQTLPTSVLQAKSQDWGVIVDAYLVNAARVGDRFAATLFCDLAGVIENGETVVTPPVRQLQRRGDFRLMQSACGGDHYIIVSEDKTERVKSV